MRSKRNLQVQTTVRAIALQTLWLQANRGVLRKVALQLGVSHQIVGEVYRGRKRSQRIHDALRRLGAPVA